MTAHISPVKLSVSWWDVRGRPASVDGPVCPRGAGWEGKGLTFPSGSGVGKADRVPRRLSLSIAEKGVWRAWGWATKKGALIAASGKIAFRDFLADRGGSIATE